MFYVCECAVSKVLQEPILVSEHHHVDKVKLRLNEK